VEQLVVRDRLEWSLLFHEENIGPGFSTAWERTATKQRG